MQNRLKCLVPIIVLGLLPIGTTLQATFACVQSPESGQIGAQNSREKAHEALINAWQVMGIAAVHHRIMHLHATAAIEQSYQSDRSYPPYFSMMSTQELWLDLDNRVQRISEKYVFPGSSAIPEVVTMDDGVHAEITRGGHTRPIHRHEAVTRELDPWAVIADWLNTAGVQIAGTETYRDYPRTVLVRDTPYGPQRLFIDAKTGYPVKLDFYEPHYLWGQRHVEYIWSTWVDAVGVSYPGAVFRTVDGEVEYSRTNGDFELIAPDKAPSLTPPAKPAQDPPDRPEWLQPIPPTVTKIGDKTWLLSNPGYNEVVTEAGGEIYLLDATQGEGRARADADAIAKLIPGQHHVNVVVTDLAWPHIAGLRYWVAQGATIVSHRAARSFLQQVVARRWKQTPDQLEQKRRKNPRAAELNFVPIEKTTPLASGRLTIVPIDGIASELALVVYLSSDKFLWASDYVQSVNAPTRYANEVIQALQRASIRPERVAAEHLPITGWSDIVRAQLLKAD